MLCRTCKRVEVSTTIATYPFCSVRCQQIDLGAWADEKYRIATKDIDEQGEALDDELGIIH